MARCATGFVTFEPSDPPQAGSTSGKLKGVECVFRDPERAVLESNTRNAAFVHRFDDDASPNTEALSELRGAEDLSLRHQTSPSSRPSLRWMTLITVASSSRSPGAAPARSSSRRASSSASSTRNASSRSSTRPSGTGSSSVPSFIEQRCWGNPLRGPYSGPVTPTRAPVLGARGRPALDDATEGWLDVRVEVAAVVDADCRVRDPSRPPLSRSRMAWGAIFKAERRPVARTAAGPLTWGTCAMTAASAGATPQPGRHGPARPGRRGSAGRRRRVRRARGRGRPWRS